MLSFVARRLVGAVTVILATLVVSFGLFFIAPNDPAAAMCGDRNCTQERYESIKKSLDLDKPVVQQFGLYLKGLVAGREFESSGAVRECGAPCLGFSYKFDQPVLGMLLDRFWVTLSLVAGAAVVYLVVGVLLGSAAARRRGTAADRALVSTTLVMSSIPYYIFGLMIALYLTIFYSVLPRGSWTPPSESLWKWVVGLFTPWLVLGVYNSTAYARYSRGSMVETLGEDYIRTARAKGLSDRSVIYKHALRAGMAPVITILGLDVAAQLTGAIFTERIFDLPGLGNFVLEGLSNGDLPVIMGTVLVGATMLVLMNFLVDIGYSLLDPRVRLA